MWALSSRSLTPWFRRCLLCSTGGTNIKTKKNRLTLRLAGLLCVMILLMPGCVSSTARPTQTLPVRPELTSLTATGDGGIMMDKRDAAELLIYIEALEQACGVVQ